MDVSIKVDADIAVKLKPNLSVFSQVRFGRIPRNKPVAVLL